MLLLSLNVRGLGGKTKQCSLRSLFLSIRPGMILLQETMCNTYPALHAFSKLLPNWEFYAISASGLSGGLLTAWNPHRVRCRAFETVAGILVRANFHDMNTPLDILNCYGPYRDRDLFWDKVLRGGLLNSPNLIVGGDLNLTMGASETWGKWAALDPLTSHFKLLFYSVGLVDIAPPSAGPTWRNGMIGDEGISKRLDHFLIASSLIPSLLVHRVWTHHSDISDHYPVYFEWNKSVGNCNYPFKFNRAWLKDPDFISWVSDKWPELSPSSPGSDLDLHALKLRTLKKDVKDWI